MVLSAVPLIVVLLFDLEGLRPLAATTALPLVIGATYSGWSLRQYPLRSIIVASSASVLFLVLLFAVFMPHLADHLIGPKTAARATAIRQSGEEMVIYKLRDEELLFLLPDGVRICRSPEELTSHLRESRSSLLVIRERDLAALETDQPAIEAEIVARVEGVDLGRGRRAVSLLLRTSSITTLDEKQVLSGVGG